MKTMIDRLLGRTRVLVDETERMLWIERGEVRGILGAGEHVLPNRGNGLKLERHRLADRKFTSAYLAALLDKCPADVAAHLTEMRALAGQILLVERDGAVFMTVSPESRHFYWTDAGPWTITPFEIATDARVPDAVLARLRQAGYTNLVQAVEVAEGQAGLVFIDGTLADRLAQGHYGYWTPGRRIMVKLVDLARQSLDVTGQELLTRDRVTLRINVAADYRVVDPALAVTAVKDYGDALYRALQYAFRRTLGALTLDQILERKVMLDAEAAEEVRSAMAAIGIDVVAITLKDVILPGEMRDLLNQVVAAEKAAEANVIRRREETNATRSLLNTAKLMAENPVMLRLKELESLEVIAGQVQSLTVHNGTGGLMNDIARLTDRSAG